jgi:hypothetical protein
MINLAFLFISPAGDDKNLLIKIVVQFSVWHEPNAAQSGDTPPREKNELQRASPAKPTVVASPTWDASSAQAAQQAGYQALAPPALLSPQC